MAVQIKCLSCENESCTDCSLECLESEQFCSKCGSKDLEYNFLIGSEVKLILVKK